MMKNAQSILFIFSITILIFSCADGIEEEQAKKEMLLRSIASSPVYVQLQGINDQQAFNIATQKYDLESIVEFVQQQNESSICNLDENGLSAIKGGLLYKELECKGSQLRTDFMAMHHEDLVKLTPEDFVAMREIYKANKGNSPLTIEQIIQERAINEVQQ